MACFSIRYKHQYLPLPVYEVPAIRVNTAKSTYTFTSVLLSCLRFSISSICSTVTGTFGLDARIPPRGLQIKGAHGFLSKFKLCTFNTRISKTLNRLVCVFDVRMHQNQVSHDEVPSYLVISTDTLI